MILLDTHIVVWLAFEPQRLSKRAVDAIRHASREGGIAIAGVTLSELAWLAENRRIQITLSTEAFLRESARRFTVLPITPEIALQAVRFPNTYPRDPQDRIIGATALVEGLELVTHDRVIRKSGLVPVIW